MNNVDTRIVEKLATWSSHQAKDEWSSPLELPPDLPTAPVMSEDLIPQPLRPLVMDAADRMQITPDFLAIPMLVSLSSLIGRRLGVKPKAKDDWTVIPNLYGMIVARPGYMKSPALKEALKPFDRLVAGRLARLKEESADRQAQLLSVQSKIEGCRAKIKNNSKSKNPVNDHAEQVRLADLIKDLDLLKKAPSLYYINDSTVEKLIILLESRPSGILVLRDELFGFFKSLDKPGRETDRTFYLEAWNGDGRYIVTRVTRETNVVEGVCLAILGGIQPSRLSDYIRSALNLGSGDDGLAQRFQLAVYPDDTPNWKNIDRYPDTTAKNTTFAVFKVLDELDFREVLKDTESDVPTVRFTAEAQIIFDEWREKLETRLRSKEIDCPAFESHLAKFRSLVPSLALLFQCIDHAANKITTLSPNAENMSRAIAWADFLECHAKKIYSIVLTPELHAVKQLAKKILEGQVCNNMSVRALYRHHWAHLDTPKKLEPALEILTKHNWLKVIEANPKIGRPTETIRLNPGLFPDLQISATQEEGSEHV